MSSKSVLPILFALALAPVAYAQSPTFSIAPAQPRFQESVVLHVDETVDAYDSIGAQISMSGNTITVAFYDRPQFVILPGGPFDLALGQFPTGDYDVSLMHGTPASGFSSLGTLHFHVGDAPSSDHDVPLGNFSDLWWNPSESGWGITIVEHPSSNVFAAWFVYGSDGKPIWYVLPGGSWKTGLFSGNLYRTTGPYFGGAFSPAEVTATRAGTASLSFTDLSHGTLSYTVDGVTATKSIEREAF